MDETNGGGGQPVFLVLILIYSLYLFFSHTLLFFILISLPLPPSHLSTILILLHSPSLALFLHLHNLCSAAVSISPPSAGPQLYGVPVLLPTRAKWLFPLGQPPGPNDWTLQSRRQQLPHIQPLQQVGRASRSHDYGSP